MLQRSPFSTLHVLYSRVLRLTDDGDQLTEAGKENDDGENLNLSVQYMYLYCCYSVGIVCIIYVMVGLHKPISYMGKNK